MPPLRGVKQFENLKMLSVEKRQDWLASTTSEKLIQVKKFYTPFL
jgi:hypothetical protein